jgi:NitT/TauT family transport system permease protein
VISGPLPPVSVREGGRILTFWNIVAALLVLGVLVFFAEASRGVGQTLAELRATPLSLDPANLPQYAAAMLLSLLFTSTYATWAAKSRRAEVLLIPLLDILQSVPILVFSR